MAARMMTTDYEDRASGLIAYLRDSGITDERVLDAIAAVPRERFVDPTLAQGAYYNEPLPIGCDQTISAPYIVAYMTAKLDLHEGHNALEIGTGSGYQAAILARLARHVYTIERHKVLLDKARALFADLGIDTITAVEGDGSAGWPGPLMFDRIIVTASARKIPQALTDQLKVGGKMILPTGRWPWQEMLVLLSRTQQGLQRQDLLPVRFVPLVNG